MEKYKLNVAHYTRYEFDSLDATVVIAIAIRSNISLTNEFSHRLVGDTSISMYLLE